MSVSDFQKYLDTMEKHTSQLFDNRTELMGISKSKIMKDSRKIKYILPLISCEAVSGNFEPAIPVAIAFELGYSSSLIIDDIFDDTKKRSKDITLHQQYGKKAAILTSLVYIFEIFNQISKTKNLDTNNLIKILNIFGESGIAACEGEYSNKSSYDRYDKFSENKYLEMIRDRTGKLFATATACGGVCGGGSDDLIKSLYKFGENLGTAYQLHDDIYDIFGDEEKGGKSIFNNVKNSQANMLLIHAYRNSSEKDFLKSKIGKIFYNSEEIKKLQEYIENKGSLDYTKNLIQETVYQNEQILDHLDIENKYKLLDIQKILVRTRI